MKKLTVKSYLNARTGEPNTSVPNPYYKNPGDVISVNRIVLGTCLDGNSIWYCCADDGQFYWSGGFTEVEFQLDNCKLSDFDEPEAIMILNSMVNELEHELSSTIKDCLGIGIGYKEDDMEQGLALVIFAKTILPTSIIPDSKNFRGVMVPIYVNQISRTTHHAKWDTLPFRMGGSISNQLEQVGPGSRGLLLYKWENGKLNTSKVYLLTCFHVLLYSLINTAKVPYKPIAPALCASIPYDNQPAKSLLILEGDYNSSYDYAVVDVTELKEASAIENGVGVEPNPFNGCYTRPELMNAMGLRVTAYGAETGQASGNITHINVPVTIEDTGMKFFNIWIANKISTGGDSGCPVVDDSNKIVGYIIGGDDLQYSFIMPLDNLIYNKNFRII